MLETMRAVIQRVKQAQVRVSGGSVGVIGTGLLVLVGVAPGDRPEHADYLAAKILGMRIFPDAAGKMNLDIAQIHGQLLVVSQFTLYANCTRGRRPSFDGAASPAEAERLYDHFVDRLRTSGIPVSTGTFQAEMEVDLTNQGPVTILLDTADAPPGRFPGSL
jgi:D-aminoacyl-tRNA deacylase